MKTYLFFHIDGTVDELKTKTTKFNLLKFKEFDFFKEINYKLKNYILLYNITNNIDININISNIPFYNDQLYGDFSILQVNNFDDLTIETFSYIKYHRLIDTKDILYFDYSSDDFSPDTCDENNNC